MSFRRTKIVATLGPASSSPEVLEQLILAGIDVARLNFSHGSAEDHKARAQLVRAPGTTLSRQRRVCNRTVLRVLQRRAKAEFPVVRECHGLIRR